MKRNKEILYNLGDSTKKANINSIGIKERNK
jgi:hypothetical protein